MDHVRRLPPTAWRLTVAASTLLTVAATAGFAMSDTWAWRIYAVAALTAAVLALRWLDRNRPRKRTA
ncbi:hypothetical protein [Herbidospora daliensis]|uniref:hypothetical protein n=1 Tax=Herbidospora daliensis TaxID=295585 RepID=UPI0007826F40|nr:hypothetical protein [Herbidospora daliensis]